MPPDNHTIRPYTPNQTSHDWLTTLLSGPGQLNIAEPLQQVPEALALDLNDRALQAFDAFEHWSQANALNELMPVMAACRQNSASGV